MGLVALCIPWVVLALAVVSGILFVLGKWKFGVGLLILAVLGNWQFQCLPISAHDKQERGESLQVLSFNSNLSPLGESVSERRKAIAGMIESISPDILFITENFYYAKDLLWEEIKNLYPYASEPIFCVGNKIYSKYPILVDSVYNDTYMAYGISCCRIDYCGAPVDVIGVHLSSNNYSESMEYMTPDSVMTRNQARKYLKNIANAGSYREREASKIADYMKSLPGSRALIVMGDFNDVSGSPTLDALESLGLKDAWWKGGLGYGATIHDPLPFRIDHIMYNEGLKLRSIKKVSAKGLSDHDALVATFSIK